MKSFSQYIIESRWKTLSPSEAKSNKDVAQEVGEILKAVYSQFPGGHRQFTSADPIGTDDVDVVNVDDDPAVDAVVLTQRYGGGRKIHGMGSDGSQSAKRALMARLKEILSKEGNYTELSGRPAEILMGMGVKPINDPKRIEAIVKRDPKVEFEWLGNGWYARTFSGGKWMKKIMVGNPK